MMKMTLSKILGLKDPHDEIIDIFARLGHKGRILDAPAGYGFFWGNYTFWLKKMMDISNEDPSSL